MTRLYVLFLLGLIFLFSCEQEIEIKTINVPALRASSIYDYDSVQLYTNTYRETHKDIAESYYKKGLEQMDLNPKKAIYYLKRAITLNPSLAYYKELGAYLTKQGMYKESYETHSFIVEKKSYKEGDDWVNTYVFSKPDTETFYDYLLSSILNYEGLDGYLIYEANEADISIEKLKQMLIADQRFNYAPDSKTYKNIMIQFLSEEEIETYKSSTLAYNDFLLSIEDTSRAFSITDKNVQNFKYDRSGEFEGEYIDVTDFYIHFLKEKQDNPQKWYEYNFNHYFSINDSIDVVVYAIDTSVNACPKDMRHIYHMLTTYTKGKIIDQKLIAAQAGETLILAEFKNNKITRSEFKRYWKKPYLRNDFDNNIIKTEFLIMNNYSIEPNGIIKEEAVSNEGDYTVSPKDSTI